MPGVPPRQPRAGRAATGRLAVLGRQRARFDLTGPGTTLSIELTPRQSEIVWLLTLSRAGLSGRDLAAGLGPQATVPAVMAEVGRLRRVLGTVSGVEVLARGPYRLTVPVLTDAVQALRLVARGAADPTPVPGPPLPGSQAPAVVAAREAFLAAIPRAVGAP